MRSVLPLRQLRERTWFAIGGRNTVVQDHAASAATILRAAGQVEITDNIISAKWMKLILNAAELVPSAILGVSIVEAAGLPGMRDLMLRAGNEAVQAVLGLGHKLIPIMAMPKSEPVDPHTYAEQLFDVLLNHYALPHTRATVLQDWQKGRRSEATELNGYVVDRLTDLGIPAPVNRAAMDVARSIEAGDLEPSQSHLSLLQKLADSHADAAKLRG